MEEAEKVARGEKVEGRYLTYFLTRTGLPMKTVYSNVTEMLLAGVDTVKKISHVFFLLHLSLLVVFSVLIAPSLSLLFTISL